MTRMTVEVEFDVPHTVSRAELRDFITDALSAWGGERHPDDHLFDSLKVHQVRFITKQKA